MKLFRHAPINIQHIGQIDDDLDHLDHLEPVFAVMRWVDVVQEPDHRDPPGNHGLLYIVQVILRGLSATKYLDDDMGV